MSNWHFFGMTKSTIIKIMLVIVVKAHENPHYAGLLLMNTRRLNLVGLLGR
jgi:hypothetical protein